MAIALLIIGAILASTGVQGTQSQLFALIVSDFSGAGNFWYWIFGLLAIGAVGYYKPLEETSRLFLFLVILVFILSNGGFWQQLVAAINSPVTPAPTPAPSSGVAAPASVANPISTTSATAASAASNVATQVASAAASSATTAVVNTVLGGIETFQPFSIG